MEKKRENGKFTPVQAVLRKCVFCEGNCKGELGKDSELGAGLALDTEATQISKLWHINYR